MKFLLIALTLDRPSVAGRRVEHHGGPFHRHDQSGRDNRSRSRAARFNLVAIRWGVVPIRVVQMAVG